MSDMTPAKAEAQMVAIGVRIGEARDKIAELDQVASMAALRFELAFARALLNSEGPNAEARKAHATLAVETEYTEKVVAELNLRAARNMMQSLSQQSDLARSISSSVRASMQVA